MSSINKYLFKCLHLNHAYGQLIALIFVPITIFDCVGVMLVLTEISYASRSHQKQVANVNMTRFHWTFEYALDILSLYPWQYDQAHNAMQNMLNEKHLVRAAILDDSGKNRLGIGFQEQAAWPDFDKSGNFIGPILHKDNHIYAIKVNENSFSKGWLALELDYQPLEIGPYRVLFVLFLSGLLTLLLLLLRLNFYSRRWIAPLYEIRMQFPRLNADTLGQ